MMTETLTMFGPGRNWHSERASVNSCSVSQRSRSTSIRCANGRTPPKPETPILRKPQNSAPDVTCGGAGGRRSCRSLIHAAAMPGASRRRGSGRPRRLVRGRGATVAAALPAGDGAPLCARAESLACIPGRRFPTGRDGRNPGIGRRCRAAAIGQRPATTLRRGSGTMASNEWAEAKAARERADYATELRVYRLLADRGDARAQTYLGVMYDKGRGVPAGRCRGAEVVPQGRRPGRGPRPVQRRQHVRPGPRRAAGPCRGDEVVSRAADQGDARAQHNIGVLYERGRGVPQGRRRGREVVPHGRRARLRARPIQPRRTCTRGAAACRRTMPTR